MKKIDEILALEDEEEIIIHFGEFIWGKLEFEYENISRLNEVEKTFLYVDILEGEVNNGGFDQFFFNSSGDYTYEILEAYKNIRAYKTSELISEAIKNFPILPVSSNTIKRRDVMQDLHSEISKIWDNLSDKFYEYEEDIMKLLVEYIKENKNLF